MSVPIITLTLDGMKESISAAFLQRNVELDTQIQQALDHECRPDILQARISGIVQQAVNTAVTEAVQSFFNYGPGHPAIRRVVYERLTSELAEMAARQSIKPEE